MACDIFFDLPGELRMPAFGYGTWQATNEDELKTALNVALETGYRHIDSATIYQNEHVIGGVLKKWFSSGKLSREDIFLVTKLPPCGMRADDVPIYLKESLEKFQVDYIDLYLVHMPFGLKNIDGQMFPTTSDGFCDTDVETDHLAIWKAMEEQVDAGLTKTIGLSNFNVNQITRILENARIRPACLQIELQVYLQQNALVEFCQKNGIVVTAYSSLGSPGLSKIGLDIPDVLNNRVVKKIGKKHGKTPAQVVLRQLVQKNIAVIPKSIKPDRIRENFNIFDFTLDEDDMNALNDLDKGIRIIDFEFAFKGIKNHPEYPFDECK